MHRRGAGALTLLRLNLWRGWLQAKRNFIGCFGAMVAMLGAVGLLIGAIYAGQVIHTFRTNQRRRNEAARPLAYHTPPHAPPHDRQPSKGGT